MKFMLTGFFLLLCINIRAYGPFNFQTLGIRSGLTDNYIVDIVQDNYGFMWFASPNGLNRYDGYQVKHYSILGLGNHNNYVSKVAEDQQGTLWIMTPTNNYYYYDRESDRIENEIGDKLSKIGIYGYVRKLFIDEDANLWCLTDDTLFYYNYSNDKLSCFFSSKENMIASLTCRHEHAYILYYDGRLGKVDFDNCIIIEEQSIKETHARNVIYLDYDLNLWLYTRYPLENSISLYNTTFRQWSYPLKKHLPQGIYAVHLIDDGNGNIWIATDNKSIFIYQTRTDQLMHISKDKNNRYSIPDTHINRIYKDKKNNMWIGTGKQGIAFTNVANMTIETCDFCKLDDISCINEDAHGNLWFGSDGDGIAVFNPEMNQTSYFKKNTIPSDIVVCSFKDSKGRVWIGTYGGGVCYYENNTFNTLHYPVKNKERDPLLYIRCIEEDNNGNIWIGTITDGLYCYDTNNEFTSYGRNNSVLITNSITDLLSNGEMLYIATSSGLYMMNTRKFQLSMFTQKPENIRLLESMIITDIYRDSRGLFWIGGQEELFIYEERQDTLICITHDKKLPIAKTRAIIEDKNNNIWITTDLGIINVVVVNDPLLPLPKFRCYHYNEDDGMGNQTFNTHAIYRDSNGNILAGGTNGMVKISPQIVQHNNNYHSNIIFTAFYLSNQLINVGDTLPDKRVFLKKNIQILDKINVKHSDNFAIDVSAMNYKNSKHTHFRYRLSKNEEWIMLTGNRLYFSRLPIGVHQLEVTMENDNIDWQGSPAVLTINVTPPLWLSTPAYICYLSLTLGLIIYVILRIKRKHHKKILEQRREMEISQQHEMDEAKLRFFTNVSHDLRTPLSLIITPLERLLALPGQMVDSYKKDLELIYRNALLLMNEINQLLDLRKLEKGEKSLQMSHGNLSEFIKEICKDFESYPRSKNIRFSLHIRSNDLNIDFDRKKTQRILTNLLSNAFKYNIENGDVVVTVDKILGINGPLVRIRVADTGIGIQSINKDRVFDRFFQEQHSTEYVGSGIGLHIVKEYVTLLGGEIRIEENHPRGSIFIITLPITTEEIIEDISVEEDIPVNEISGEKHVSILVVEDNNDFMNFLTNCLVEQYGVFNASDGKKALNILAKQSIDIVISDVMMPVMDGLELCKKIKNDIRFSHIPVILLTARSREEHIVTGLKGGADDYITKPFNIDILLLRIQKLLEWKYENHKKFATVEIAPGEITISSFDEQLIEKCISLVEQNMDNGDFSVEELSTGVGMSRGNLYKKLVSITGKSPIEFIRILRLKRGQQLMEKSQLNISEIAYKIGLSPKQFSIHFKNEFGTLPSNFKKR